MSTALNNLNFMISLVDRVSAPMGRVMQSITQAQSGFQAGLGKIAVGAAGLVGAAYSVDRLLEPTKQMQLALGEVKSLGVADETLNTLRQTALAFSTQYGGSAADVVRSSYDIQSAISGLAGDELAAFTRTSGLLAKGTKASANEITSYVGKMYGVFQAQADTMGRAVWIDKMAAHTAMAVNIFKAEGKSMGDAFEGIGALAANMGVPMAEQFAVLGQLQSGWSGSEAGTKYKQFLNTVSGAQEELGLKFVDSKNHLLPIYDILSKIRNKFTDLKDVSQMDKLASAFGDDGVAAVGFLLDKVDSLKASTEAIAGQNTLDSLSKMADAMTDPWGRMRSSVEGVSISLGTQLLPVITPVLDKITKLTQQISDWTAKNPVLAANLGQIALSLIAVGAAASYFTLLSGFGTLATTAWTLALNLVGKPLWGFAKSIWGAIPAVWSFTTALFANPITWWVLGIGALIALVAAAVIYWDDWTAVVVDFGGRFLEMIGVFSLVDKVLAAWNGLKAWWAGFKIWLAGLNPFGSIMAGLNKAIGLANMLPGVNISPISTGPVQTAPANGPIQTAPAAAPKGGGIIKQMSSVMNANKSMSVGALHVHTSAGAPLTGAKLRDELLFAGG